MSITPAVSSLLKLGALAVLVLALAWLPLPLAAALVLAAALGILALIDPVWSLYALVLAVPVQELFLLPGGLSVVQAALLLAAASWGLRILAHPEHPLLWGRVLPGLALLLWTLLLSSSLTPYSQNAALTETLRWSTVVLVYLLALNSLSTGEQTGRKAAGLVACLLLAPAANAVFGLWQFFTGSGPPSFAVAGGFVRAYGTIGKPNSFAGYMNMAWPLAVALALALAWVLLLWLLRRKHAPRQAGQAGQAGQNEQTIQPGLALLLPALAASTLAAVLLVGALLASFSRGGWLGAAGGGAGMLLAALLLVRRTARQYIWRWAGAALAGGLLLVLAGSMGLLPDALEQRAASIANNLRLFDVRNVPVTPANFAVVERMAQMQAAWHMFLDHPLTGVGPGNYTLAYEGQGSFAAQPYFFDPWYTSRGHAHNYYLHLAAEAGILGLAAYLLLLLLLYLQVRAALLRARGWFWHGIVVGGCGIITAIAVHNLFENLHVLNMGVQLGALWGLLAAIEKRTYDER